MLPGILRQRATVSLHLSHCSSPYTLRYRMDNLHITKGIIIGMARVGQHCSHTFGKSMFPWQ